MTITKLPRPLLLQKNFFPGCRPQVYIHVGDGGVSYMSDAILVNLRALMQQWTSDKYLATVSLSIQRMYSELTKFNIFPSLRAASQSAAS